MSEQIYQELTDYRLSRRTRLPATVTMDNEILEVADISLGGIKIKTTPELIHELAIVSGAIHRVQLDIKAYEQSISMVLDIKVEYDNPGEGTAGCSFLDMTPEKREILRILIKAYLSGNETDIKIALDVCSGLEKLISRPDMKGLHPEEEIPLPDTRREYAYLFLFVIALIGIITGGTYMVIEKSGGAGNGVLVAKSTIYTAPYSGTYKLLKSMDTDFITKDVPLAEVISGEKTYIYKSPCDCFIMDSYLFDGTKYEKGDKLFSLVELGTAPVIKAWMKTQQIEYMVIGSTVTIEIVGEKYKTNGRVIGIRSAAQEDEFIKDSNVIVRANNVIVTIKPDISIPVNYLKKPVKIEYNYSEDEYYKYNENEYVDEQNITEEIIELPSFSSDDGIEEMSIPDSIKEVEKAIKNDEVAIEEEQLEESILPPARKEVVVKKEFPHVKEEIKNVQENKPALNHQKNEIKKQIRNYND